MGNFVRLLQTIERTFKYDATKGVDPTDIAKVDREIAVLRAKYRIELLEGRNKLQAAKDEITLRRSRLQQQVMSAHRELLKAAANLRAASGE